MDSQTVAEWLGIALLILVSGYILPVVVLGAGRSAASGVTPTRIEWRSLAVRVGVVFASGLVIIGLIALLLLRAIARSN